MLMRVTEKAEPVSLKETVHAPDASRGQHTVLFEKVQSKQLKLTGKANTTVEHLDLKQLNKMNLKKKD